MRLGRVVGPALLLLATATASGASATIPTGPPGDAFYNPPNPLPSNVEGSVVWARRFNDGAALPSAAANYRVIYETISRSGAAVALSGTLAVPHGVPPPQGWPLLSWAHGTVGNAPECAPSRSSEPNIEQRMLDGFVARGYAVAQTDYEGNGTPGVHPYLVGASLAFDITDIVRASREIDPQIGRKWVIMGHSEGGAAALATAAIGQRIAPELDLIGAVSYAPFSYAENMLLNETRNDTPNDGLAIVGLLIEGFSTVDPRIVPSEMLEPEALRLMPDLQRHCLPEIERNSDWARIVPRTIFRPQAEAAIEALYGDLLANDPVNFRISVPTLLVQWGADRLIVPESTLALRDSLARKGTPVSFRAYIGATHGSVLAAAADDVAAWLAGRFK